MMSPPYSALAVANEFIRMEPDGLSHLKLQKLVYYAQGCALADNFRLVEEQPQVWKFGPVFKTLYFQMKYHGGDLIDEPELNILEDEVEYVPESDKRSNRIIREVWDRYGGYSANQLSERTHRNGTPWYEVVREHQGRVPEGRFITEDAMRLYFERHRFAA